MLRIGEPAKVRSCLQAFTLKAQLAKAVAQDCEILEARSEQQSLRRRLWNSKRRKGEYLSGWVCGQLYSPCSDLSRSQRVDGCSYRLNRGPAATVATCRSCDIREVVAQLLRDMWLEP